DRAHPAHLGPDPGAAGDHDDPVLPDLRRPDRLAHRADGRLQLHGVHRPRPGDDERDPEQLRQHLLQLLRRQVRTPHRGAAGQPDAQLGDPGRLRGRRGAARADDGRDRARDRDVLHHGAHPAPAGDPDHRPAGFDDLLAGRLRQRGLREEVRRRGDRADLHPHPADLPGRRVLFGQAAAGLGRDGHALQPDLLHGQRVPLRPAGHLGRAAVDRLRADAGLRRRARRAVAVAAAPRRGAAQLMRVLVLGAGGTGGYFGGRLAQSGAEVAFLVRPARAAQLARDGLRIRSELGDADLAVRALTADALSGALRDRRFDLVVLSCKAWDLDAAIADVAPAVEAGAAVLPILNGLLHYAALDARFG